MDVDVGSVFHESHTLASSDGNYRLKDLRIRLLEDRHILMVVLYYGDVCFGMWWWIESGSDEDGGGWCWWQVMMMVVVGGVFLKRDKGIEKREKERGKL
ncbi:hypothetical protein HanPI659440_Chr08g0290241 [Helianthus annuus]|nr:hypothetical protein HanPI659440_Chr08g0290241 [Helianthus annuus]